MDRREEEDEISFSCGFQEILNEMSMERIEKEAIE
jgi:hypothetical protein